jgi:rod shape determining protein RodA
MQRAPLAWTRSGLLLLGVVLTAIGIVFVDSATGSAGHGFPSRLARDQVVKAVVALAAFLAVNRVHYRRFESYAYVIYGGLLVVLVVLVAIRIASESHVRWIRLKFFQIQPSELMKIALVLCLARYLRFRRDQRRLGGLAAPFLLTAVPTILVLLQPDLGTSLMLPPVLLVLLYVAGARRFYLAAALLAGLSFVPAAYLLRDRVPLMQPYQQRRLVAFFQQKDPATRRLEAYQLAQSEIALGAGGPWGRGLKQGPQNSLNYLPARHTDFIFSVVGEEWGFAGASAVSGLLLVLVLLCFRVALHTREPFGRLVASGIGAAFAVQSLQNLGMTMGLSPITGIPLPFVSFGGSSLVTSFLALGLVANISSRQLRVVASKDLDPDDPPASVAVLTDCPAGSLAGRWPV